MELHGLTINFLGDSITEGHGTTSPGLRFTDLLGKQYGILPRNYGIGGTRYAHQLSTSENPMCDRDFCQRYTDMEPQADAIVVFGGTNDYGHGDAPFGTPADNDSSSFCGACNQLFSGLKDLYPTAKILVIPPLHRCNENNPKGDGSAKAPRQPLEEYVRAIIASAHAHGLHILDLFSDNTLDPNDPAIKEAFVPDGLHPNDAGHQILARRIAEALKAL